MVPQSKAPLASWITGWFNLLGQVAVTTGIRYAACSWFLTLAKINWFCCTASRARTSCQQFRPLVRTTSRAPPRRLVYTRPCSFPKACSA